MKFTGSTRATAATAGMILLGGLPLTLYGVIRDDFTRTVGGTCLTITAVIVIALLVIRQWVVNTSNERRRLAEDQRRTQDEYTSYIALKAALVAEQGRLRQDISAESAALTARLAVERSKMEADFEEQKATLISETMEATVRMFHNGKFAPEAAAAGKLIPFPQQEPERQRAREHGVVGT
jgi:hypothetical protein